jgi:hypothetical protein
VTVRSSPMTAVATGGGGAADSSTSTVTANPSSACTGSASAYRGWEWGSEGAARALSATRFMGAGLRTLVSARLQKGHDEVEEQTKRKTHGNDTKDKNLHLGADPRPLHRTI